MASTILHINGLPISVITVLTGKEKKICKKRIHNDFKLAAGKIKSHKNLKEKKNKKKVN